MAGFALLTQSPFCTAAHLALVLAAYTVRAPQVAAAWTPFVPGAVARDVRIVSSLAELRDGDVPMVATRTIDQPQFDAYHFIRPSPSGVQVPYGIILCDGQCTVEEMLRRWLHELVECQVDEACNLYLPCPGKPGKRAAVEVKDPCQEDHDLVTLPNGATLDDGPFILGAWFGLASGPTLSDSTPLDEGDVRPDGYCAFDDGTQVDGELYVPGPHKTHPHARGVRRRALLVAA